MVSSAVSSWTCTTTYGCDPDSTKEGVFGTGVSALWQYPVPQIDFNGITADLVSLKSLAQNSGGIYLGDSGAQGYHVYLQSDGTFDVYRVDSTGNGYWSYSSQWGWEQEYNNILSETFLQRYTPSPNCSLVFVEDNLWLEGTVKDKVTIASANLIQPDVDTTIILNGNIKYAANDGSSGLTAIAEEDVLIPLISPDDMVLNGVFIAQKGHFGRNHYTLWWPYRVPSAYTGYVVRNSLSINGTIVSNGRVGTQWTSG